MTRAAARPESSAALAARPRRVLGIDPGTAVTGYGVVEYDGRAASLVECGVIRTNAKAPLPSRLHDIHAGVTELIARHQPDTVAVEDVFYARNGERQKLIQTSQRSGLVIAPVARRTAMQRAHR